MTVTLTAGRFDRRTAAVTHAALVIGAGAAKAMWTALWPSPDGPFWTIVEAEPGAGALLVETAGGQPYSVRPDGTLARLRGHVDRHPAQRLPALDELRNAPPVPTDALLLDLTPTRRPDLKPDRIYVYATGSAARHAIRRCLAEGATGTMVPVVLHSSGAHVTRPHLQLRVRGPATARLARYLNGLPDTTVAVPCDGSARVLTEWGYGLPVDSSRVAALVPANQTWLITSDSGGWRIESHGEEVDFSILLTTSISVPASAAPAPPDLTSMQQEVRVRPSPRHSGRADAVLVTDDELTPLRQYIRTRPLSETAHVVFGPGHHLLIAPPALLDEVPIGTPLRRIGPGGLFLESTAALVPPVPAAARQRLFAPDEESLVVLCRTGAYRLQLADTRPAWALWLGPSPAVEGDLSVAAKEILSRYAAAQDDPAPVQPRPSAAAAPAGPVAGNAAPTMAQALSHAAHALANGHLEEAAEWYEFAGQDRRAAELFRRAAA
ncbi:hypothetical protein, partial [Rhizocola hellebori]|uniref:hypothetical protein n=1 Tax=Rhizocola hellebori TaxID=1392758 RepID=UPI00194543CC